MDKERWNDLLDFASVPPLDDVEHFAFASPDCTCSTCTDIREEEQYL